RSSVARRLLVTFRQAGSGMFQTCRFLPEKIAPIGTTGPPQAGQCEGLCLRSSAFRKFSIASGGMVVAGDSLDIAVSSPPNLSACVRCAAPAPGVHCFREHGSIQ